MRSGMLSGLGSLPWLLILLTEGGIILREKVMALLKRALQGVNFESSDRLVDDGILDSMAVTVIISELTMEFGIDIPFEELESRNFNSVDAIVSLVGRCPKREETSII